MLSLACLFKYAIVPVDLGMNMKLLLSEKMVQILLFVVGKLKMSMSEMGLRDRLLYICLYYLEGSIYDPI